MATQRPSLADKVTISDAGKIASAQTSGGYDDVFRNKILDSATKDPAFANQMAYDYSHDTLSMTGPLVNISKMPITYSATGEVVTPENLAAFKSQATSARAEKVAIYDSEKAKGSSDVDILKKLYAATMNDLYKSGKMRFDEISLAVPLIQSPFGKVNVDGKWPDTYSSSMNFISILSAGLDGAKSRGDSEGVNNITRLMSPFERVQGTPQG